MERILSWEAEPLSARQEFPRIVWNQKVHYHFYKNPRLSLFWARSIHSMLPIPLSEDPS
jgi:hypothetical protein